MVVILKKYHHFFEMVTQLDYWACIELPGVIEDKFTMLKRVNIRFDEKKIRTTFHWKETATRDIDAMGFPEVLDCSPCSSLKLKRMRLIV